VCKIGTGQFGTRPKYRSPTPSYPVQRLSTISKDQEGELATFKGQAVSENQAAGALSGKKAIITGASRGIGAAIAQRFANEGARCVLVGRDVDALTRVKESLNVVADHVVRVGNVGDLEFWKGLTRSEVSAWLFWVSTRGIIARKETVYNVGNRYADIGNRKKLIFL
jgi:hypothetical protein